MNDSRAPENRGIAALWILGVGLLSLLQFHRLEIFSQLTWITGDKGDTRLVVYLFEHLWQTLKGNEALLSPGMFFPQKGVLGYSEALIGYEPVYAVFRLLGFAPYRAAILNFITWDFFGYLAATVLILRVFRTRALAAAIGGALYAFSSAKINQMNHLQLQPLAFPPLILLCLYSAYDLRNRLSERGLFLRLAGAALLLDLELVSCYYFAWFTSFWLVLFFTMWGWQSGFKATGFEVFNYVRRHRKAFAGAAALFLVGLVPFLRIYIPVVWEFGPRGYSDAFRMTPEFLSVFRMGPDNWLWGWMDPWILQMRAIPYEWEHRIGIGVVLGLFWIFLTGAALQLARGKKISAYWNKFLTPKTVSPIFLSTVILSVSLFFALGFKYAPRFSPWVFIFHLFPGANAIRTVVRYVIFLMLPIAAVFAAWIDGHAPKARWIWALAFLALLEQQGKFPGFSAQDDWANIERMAHTLPRNCASFYMRAAPEHPEQWYEIQLDAMLVSAATGIPTLNGYSGQTPLGWGLDPKSPHAPEDALRWMLYKGVVGSACVVWL